MPLLLVDGVKGDRGGLRVARAALPPPHLHWVRHHGHHHQRVLQCEPPCERTHLILRLPSSPPPVLRLTGAHLDLSEKGPKVLILQKWISASLYRATVECGRAPREPLSAQKVRQVLAAEESRGGEGVVQPFIICNLQVLLSPSSPTLPSTFRAELQKKSDAAADVHLCNQFRTWRDVLLQQGYRIVMDAHLLKINRLPLSSTQNLNQL